LQALVFHRLKTLGSSTSRQMITALQQKRNNNHDFIAVIHRRRV
jgi:hypothetical protein